MQAFLCNSDQQVGTDRNPDFPIVRVLVGAINLLDAQAPLDQFEKRFELPVLAVQVRGQSGFEGEVHSQKT